MREIVGVSVARESEEGVEASIDGPERLGVVAQVPLADHVGLVAVGAEMIAHGELLFGESELGGRRHAFMLQ